MGDKLVAIGSSAAIKKLSQLSKLSLIKKYMSFIKSLINLLVVFLCISGNFCTFAVQKNIFNIYGIM